MSSSSQPSSSSRLRRAFQYPDSDDSSDADLDEEHQERLISHLQAEDARKNAFYRKAFTAIPVFAAAYFLFSMLFLARSARERFIALLCASSLGVSAYTIWIGEEKDEENRRLVVGDSRGPLERFFPMMNMVFAGVLGVAAVVNWRGGRGEEAVREVLPAVVMWGSWVVRGWLRPVDLKTLEERRFGLKGA